ncbi:hypothetical protein BC937DRAFT_94982 [Endogone sp. FLAS-F59071]|nr:hypothetical protein BC937DRAFT_94982 [Endogone sp. FLAS-F59071]|eukprot:RUS20547.1 hypothetical protein BC937DRAFT_94982 [Endogone sp. FLAS-F59071]
MISPSPPKLRLMLSAFSPKDWRTATREFARILKPGGVELMESDSMLKNAPPTYSKLYNAFVSVAAARGMDLSMVHRLAELPTDAGFENAQSGEVLHPLGWKGYVGEMSLKSAGMLYRAMKPVFTHILGMTDDEYEECIVEVLRYFSEKKNIH